MEASKLCQPLIAKKPIFVVSSQHQHNLPFNFIRIDKGLLLAPHGKNADKVITVNNSDLFLNGLLDDFQSWMISVGNVKGNRSIKRRVYMAPLSMLLANAKLAYECKGQVIIGRRNGKGEALDNPLGIDSRVTNKLLEFMADTGRIDYIVGKANEHDSNASWFIPLLKLFRELNGSKVFAANGAQVVVCRERRKSKGDTPPRKQWSTMRAVTQEVTRLSKVPTAYNAMMIEHAVTLGKRELATHLYRSFTHSIDLGGRFYSDWQQTPKVDRAKVRIDGSATVELDYKALHWMLVYADAGLQFPIDSDPYLIAGYDRATIKAVSLVLLNTDNIPELARQITRSGKAATQASYAKWKAVSDQYNRQRAKSLKGKPPTKPKSLTGYIEGIPLGTNGSELIAALLKRHDSVRHLLGTKDIGLRLQRHDSDIMADILAACIAENIPCLPLHDSVVCKAKDRGLVYGIMLACYQVATEQNIKVEQVDKPLKAVKRPGIKVVSEPLFTQ